MKRIILLSILLCHVIFTITSTAQVVNLNPDPNGNPWLTGGVPKMTPEYQQKIDSIPVMVRQSFIEPPSKVDNSENKFMRPIFQQKNGCCAQASGVGYVFTYEINCLRDSRADSSIYVENQYPTHFTYNFLNNGDGGNGSYVDVGWDIIKENGCPTVLTYGSMDANGDATHWMTGYENYDSAMYNRVDHYETIDLHDPDSALVNLKQWLFNHNNDSVEFGGLASFMTNMQACTVAIIQPPLPEFGKTFLYEYYEPDPNDDNHQLTIVGFDDDIKMWDINGDGYYTNDIDVDSNGYVDLFDYEKGAFKVANSWDTIWPNDKSKGYVYWPYRFLAYGPDTTLPDPFIGLKAFIVYPLANYEPELVLRANLYHEKRKSIRFDVDYGIDALDDTPETGDGHYFAFAFKGGSYPLLGNQNYNPLEVTLDYSYFFSDEDVGKLFFDIWQGNSDTLGYLSELSLVDYRWNEIFEKDSEVSNDTIEFMYNWFSIEYDLIVPGDNQDITHDDTLYSNMVSRFSPTVKDSSTLTIENGVTIDMYDSELTIEEGSSIIIGDSVTFRAKYGDCQIIINGNINDVNEATFLADDSCSLDIILNNSNLDATFSDCDFENISLYGYTDTITVNSSSTFINSRIRGAVHLVVDSTTFTTSSISMMAPGLSVSSATIINSSFNDPHPNENNLISLYRFATYHITGDTFANWSSSYSEGQHSVAIEYSGTTGPTAMNNINENVFLSSEDGYSNTNGILVYASIANIYNNNIQDQNVGVMLTGRSQSILAGTSNFCNEETQVIKNNNICQVYASEYSFPTEFIWNAIYHDTLTKCFVHHDINPNYHHDTVVVVSNYWSYQHDPDSNLIPISHYKYLPMYNPCSKFSVVLTDAETLYQSGIDQISDGNYAGAKNTFQELISEYPQPEQANSAMKELFYLEPLADNDFSSLKIYYLTEDSIVENERLEKLGQNLANKCDEKLGNFSDAIDWYEDIIDDPATLQDSVFAIIDLENCYLQMGIDTNLKSSNYIGRMPQYKQKTVKAHQDHRDELLALLLKHQNQNNTSDKEFVIIESSKPAELLQNVPNPFKGNTQISYKLKIESNVELNIYSYSGQLIKTISEGLKSGGTHTTVIDASGLQSGIYFYSISINGHTTDSRKMTIIK